MVWPVIASSDARLQRPEFLGGGSTRINVNPVASTAAVPDEPHFLCDVWNDLKSTRPMPVYSVPGLIDHF